MKRILEKIRKHFHLLNLKSELQSLYSQRSGALKHYLNEVTANEIKGVDMEENSKQFHKLHLQHIEDEMFEILKELKSLSAL